jgi:23S rRNA pseudouridine1911/1915/1917 synthase
MKKGEHSFFVEQLKTRLDKFLSEKLSEVSRSQIQRDIESGKVEVNGKQVNESKFVVRVNDKVKYDYTHDYNNNELKPVNIPLKVLYNDHGLLIIDKPAGLTVHPGAGFKGETLASALLFHFSAKGGSAFGGKGIHLVGEEHRPGIVHRLDKDTSGVILVATTQEMYEHLKDAFAERKVKKEYLALVLGKVEKPHGVVDMPIGKSRTDFRKQTTKNPEDPKAALTEYTVLEHLKGANGNKGGNGSLVDEYTLLLVKLHTGRTHQIRVHMNSIGHPLMGDSLYGSKKTQLQGLTRQFLHAKKIEVQLPDQTWIEADSELPSDLREILINLKSKVVSSL